MFGIGGGELIFIILIVLMLFGTDKLPEMVKTMGKTMAQLKNATNDIKNEIQKGMDESGLNKEGLAELTNTVNTEINKIAEDTLGDTVAELEKAKDDIETSAKELEKTDEDIENPNQEAQETTGPIKRES